MRPPRVEVLLEGAQAEERAVEGVGHGAPGAVGAQHRHLVLIAHEGCLHRGERLGPARRHVDHTHAPPACFERGDLRVRAAGAARGVAEEIAAPLELGDRHEERGQCGQAQTRRREHAVFAVGGHVERRMRPLHRPRPHVHRLRGVETALEVEGRARPRAGEELDAFLHPRPRVVAVGLESLVVLECAAAADAHVEAAAAHHVEHGQLLGEVHRMVQRQERDAHAEAESRGAGGQKGGQHRRGRAEPVVVEVVLGDPHRVIPERLRGQHLLEVGPVDGVLAPRFVALHEVEEPEVHAPSAHDSSLMKGPSGSLAPHHGQ
jgi:hypothetical protein